MVPWRRVAGSFPGGPATALPAGRQPLSAAGGGGAPRADLTSGVSYSDSISRYGSGNSRPAVEGAPPTPCVSTRGPPGVRSLQPKPGRPGRAFVFFSDAPLTAPTGRHRFRARLGPAADTPLLPRIPILRSLGARCRASRFLLNQPDLKPGQVAGLLPLPPGRLRPSPVAWEERYARPRSAPSQAPPKGKRAETRRDYGQHAAYRNDAHRDNPLPFQDAGGDADPAGRRRRCAGHGRGVRAVPRSA